MRKALVVTMTAALLAVCAIAYSITIEDVMARVKTKFETFQRTGDFTIFYDCEANKNIVGLESEQDIKRLREDKLDKWCFVPAQVLRNYLTCLKVRPAVIMVLRPKDGSRIKPFGWDYHMIVVIQYSGEAVVLDPVLSVIEPSYIYLQRFENLDLTAKILDGEALREFLQPTEMFKPKARFPGIKPNYGKEI